MSATSTPASENLLGLLDFRLIVLILVVTGVAIAIERLINTYLSRAARRVKLEPHTTNNVILTTRILILFFAIAVIADLGGIPAEWILSISALGGAALGFASQKTIGNFIAGLFLLAAHPFRVGDFVRIGNAEGMVQEITINYTKVVTIAKNTVLVSNLQILDRDVTNFSLETEKIGKSTSGIYCYTFEIGFDHSVSTEGIREVFDAVFKDLIELPKKPEYALMRSSGIERVYMVYLYVDKPEDIFKFRPQIAEQVFSLWDLKRTRKEA